MADPYLGEIRLFAGNYAPVNWALCQGQLLAISDYQELYAVLGTTYGGNGVTLFGLPDMRGRLPVHRGTGMGLTPRAQGDRYGVETVTLTTDQIPNHTHSLMASNQPATSSSPASTMLATPAGTMYSDGIPVDKIQDFLDTPIENAGGDMAHLNLMPYLALSFIIALKGTFPSRN